MSTIDAASATAIMDEVKHSGAVYLEAPVSGSKQPAEQGTLVILAAGDKPLYDRVTPLFDVLGKASFYLGQVNFLRLRPHALMPFSCNDIPFLDA